MSHQWGPGAGRLRWMSWGVAHAIDGFQGLAHMRVGFDKLRDRRDSQGSVGSGRAKTMCGMSSSSLAQARRSGVDMASIVAAWSRSK